MLNNLNIVSEFHQGSNVRPQLKPESTLGVPSEYAGIDMFDSWSQGITEDSFFGLLQEPYEREEGVNFVNDNSTEDDKNNWLKENAPKLRPEYYKKLVDSSNSIEELKYHLPEAMEKSRIRDYTENLGFGTQLAIGVASVIPDVLAITATSLVSPITATALASTRARAFASGAIVDGAFQVLQDNYGQRERSVLEMTLSPIFSGALNSVLTHGISNKLGIHQEIMIHQEKELLGITPEVEVKLKNAKDDIEKEKIYKEAIDNSIFEKKLDSEILASKDDEAISKLIEKRNQRLKEEYEQGRLSKLGYNKLRFDNEALGKLSPSKTLRNIAHNLFIDGTLQHNKTNFSSITELQDAYEAISISQTRRIFMPLERELSDLKPNSVSKAFSVKFLDNSNIGVSNVAGLIQAIRNNKVGNKDYALDKASELLRKEHGLKPDDARKFAKKVMDASAKQSKLNGELNLRFRDEAFTRTKKPIQPSEDYFTNVFTFDGNARLHDKGIKAKDIDEFWYQGLKSHWVKRNSEKEMGKQNVWTSAKEKTTRELAKKLNRFLGTPTALSNGSHSTNDIFIKAFQESGLTEAEQKEFFDSVKTKTGSVYMKSRIPFDRSYVHKIHDENGVEKTIDILDFISTDMYSSQAKYMRDNGGRIAGQNYTFNVPTGQIDKEGNEIIMEQSLGTDEGADFIKGKVRSELEDLFNKGEISKSKATAEFARLEHWINHIQGKPTAVDPQNPMHKVMQIGANLNAWRLLGKVPLAMTAELNNVLVYSGASNYFKNVKNLKDLTKVFTDGKIESDVWNEAGDVLGLGHELIQGLRATVNDHDFDTQMYNARRGWVDTMLNKGLDISEKMAEFTLMTGGMKPYTAYMQLAMYTGLSKMIREMSENGASGFQKQVMKEMGLTDDMVQRIQSQMLKHGKSKEVFNFNKWDDDEASMMFTIGMKRIIDNVVQKPTLGGKLGITIGDKIMASTALGKSFLELKQYMLQSYVKQTGKMVESNSIYHYMMMMSQIGLLSALYIPEQYMLHSTNPEKLKEKLEPINMLNTVASRVTVFGYPSMVLGAGSRATLGENYFTVARDTNGGIAQAMLQQLPMVDLLNTMGSTLPNVAKTFYEDEYNIDGWAKLYKKSTSNIIPNTILNNYIENQLEPQRLPF